jgi:hypothetical protein
VQQISEVLEGDGSAIFATMSVGALAGALPIAPLHTVIVMFA